MTSIPVSATREASTAYTIGYNAMISMGLSEKEAHKAGAYSWEMVIAKAIITAKEEDNE